MWGVGPAAACNAQADLVEAPLLANRGTQLHLAETNNPKVTYAAVTCRISDMPLLWAKSGTASPFLGREKICEASRTREIVPWFPAEPFAAGVATFKPAP